MIVTVSCSTCLRIQAFRMLTVIELVVIKNWLCLPGMLKQDKLLRLCFLPRSLDICGCSRISDNGICALSKSCQRLELLDLTSTGVGHKRFVIYFVGSNFSFFCRFFNACWSPFMEEKAAEFPDATTGFPRNDFRGTTEEIPYWCRWRFTTQIWVVLSIGCVSWETCFSQSDSPPRSG